MEETASFLSPPTENNEDTVEENKMGGDTKDFKEKKEDVKGDNKDGDDDDMAPQVVLDENGDVVINEQR